MSQKIDNSDEAKHQVHEVLIGNKLIEQIIRQCRAELNGATPTKTNKGVKRT